MLAEQRATVAVAARRGDEPDRVIDESVARGGVALSIVADLTNDEAPTTLAPTKAELAPMDVLVNNAGFPLWKPIENTTLTEWDQTFAMNLRARAFPFARRCCRASPGSR